MGHGQHRVARRLVAARRSPNLEDRRLLVIGIDGMDWLLTRRLMDEGKLPTFRRLAEQDGFSMLLSSILPVLTCSARLSWSQLYRTSEFPPSTPLA